MNLARHATLLLKYRSIAVGGILLGCVLAFLAAYQVPSLERRGIETYSTDSDILVTQTGFPEGRVTLPDQQPSAGVALPPTGTPEPSGRNRQRFADPQRLASLALLYADIAASEQVRSKLPNRPEPGQIAATAVDATGNGTTYLPIIRLTTQASTPAAAQKLNTQAFSAFEELLQSQQKAADISDADRIRLTLLDPPSAPLLIAGRSLTPSLLAFLLCALATIALIHILEGLSLRRTGASGDAAGTPPAAGEPDWASELVELPPVGRSRRLSG